METFILVALVHAVAVASPGPDFAIVLRHSLLHGRTAALYTSIGIGLGILLHVAYSVVGLSVLVATTPWLYRVMTFIAAGYFLYIAYHALTSRASAPADTSIEQPQRTDISNKKALIVGFFTNGLNPKATLFFLSLFTAVIEVSTPWHIKLAYGAYLAVATGLWFCLLSLLLTSASVRQKLLRYGVWLDRVMGVVLILLAIHMLLG